MYHCSTATCMSCCCTKDVICVGGLVAFNLLKSLSGCLSIWLLFELSSGLGDSLNKQTKQ